MKFSIIFIASICLPAVAQQSKPFTFEGTSISATYQKFKAVHPNAKCQPLGKDKSCRLPNTPIAGVLPSRMNFNFEKGVLTNIAVFFYPAPSQQQIDKILSVLRNEYGTPKKESSYRGQVIYRWSYRTTSMGFFMPSGESGQAMIVVDIPSHRD
jgi:hypothetical protein